jgi:hypothetical protein
MRRCASNPPTQCKLPIPSWDLVQRANHVAPAVLHHHQLLTLPVVRCRWASLLPMSIKHLDEWTFLAFLPREICNPRWWGGIQQTGVYGFQPNERQIHLRQTNLCRQLGGNWDPQISVCPNSTLEFVVLPFYITMVIKWELHYASFRIALAPFQNYAKPLILVNLF